MKEMQNYAGQRSRLLRFFNETKFDVAYHAVIIQFVFV